jgi:hypothetical protein
MLADELRAPRGGLHLAGERQIAPGTVLYLPGGFDDSLGLSAQFARQLVAQLGYLASEFGNLGGLLDGVTTDNLLDYARRLVT